MKIWMSVALTGALLTAAGAAVAGDSSAHNYAGEAATIRTLRTENNRAIAARQIEAVMAIAADDYVLGSGNDRLYRSKAEMAARWRQDFADPDNHGCLRTTETVEVGRSKGVLRAAESGRWVCTGTTPQGEDGRGGKYFAHWTKRSGDWRVVSDNYVTLYCTGPHCAAD